MPAQRVQDLDFPSEVTIVEVSPRDGLQNERQKVNQFACKRRRQEEPFWLESNICKSFIGVYSNQD